MSDVLFPPLSKDDPESPGVLTRWFVAEDDRVAEDDVVAEVQVDKVSADVVAPSSGTIHLLVDEDAEVPQGAPIARIDG